MSHFFGSKGNLNDHSNTPTASFQDGRPFFDTQGAMRHRLAPIQPTSDDPYSSTDPVRSIASFQSFNAPGLIATPAYFGAPPSSVDGYSLREDFHSNNQYSSSLAAYPSAPWMPQVSLQQPPSNHYSCLPRHPGKTSPGPLRIHTSDLTTQAQDFYNRPSATPFSADSHLGNYYNPFVEPRDLRAPPTVLLHHSEKPQDLLSPRSSLSPVLSDEESKHIANVLIARSDPPTNKDGKYICKYSKECEGEIFDRKCEWNKHMDRHDKPYRCSHPKCAELPGFTYSGGLLRHEREEHGKHGGPKSQLMCPYYDCKRKNKGFTRKENLDEHIRRVHITSVQTHLLIEGNAPDVTTATAGMQDETDIGSSTYTKHIVNPEGVGSERRASSELLWRHDHDVEYRISDAMEQMQKLHELFEEQGRKHSKGYKDLLERFERESERVKSIEKTAVATCRQLDGEFSKVEEFMKHSQALAAKLEGYSPRGIANEHRRLAEEIQGLNARLEESAVNLSSQHESLSKRIQNLEMNLKKALERDDSDLRPSHGVSSDSRLGDNQRMLVSEGGLSGVAISATSNNNSHGQMPQHTFRSLYQMLTDERSARQRLEVQIRGLRDQMSSLDYQVPYQSNAHSERSSSDEQSSGCERSPLAPPAEQRSLGTAGSPVQQRRAMGRHSRLESDISPHDSDFNIVVQHIVRSLQLRVNRLILKTESQKGELAVFQRTTTQSEHSGDEASENRGAYRYSRNYDDTASPITLRSSIEEANSASIRQSVRGRRFVRGNQCGNIARCRSYSPPAAFDLPRDLQLIKPRAKSEPPNCSSNRLWSEHLTCGATTHASGGDLSTNAGVQTQETNLNSQQPPSSLKRKGREGRDDDEGEEDQRGEPNEKRRRTIGPELHKRNLRFPCIFYIGEPDHYPTHTRRYEFISHLLRHLKSHNFFVCSKCFTRFDSCISFGLHDQNPCAKSCSRKNCIRHIPRNVERQHTCDCITSPDQQWKELFQVQYPFKPIPDVVTDTADTVQSMTLPSDTLQFDEMMIPDASDLTFLDGIVNDNLETLTDNANLALINPVQIDRSILNDLQHLQQTVQRIESRLNQPNDRESDLEMVLGMVWQALVRSGSSETNSRSHLYRLVERFASNILDSSDRTQATTRTQLERSNAPADSMTTLSSEDWPNVFNDHAVPGPSRRIRSDSGYQT